MPDYDVGVLSLATPPPAAPVTSYRPAVRVKNNGIHPANVSGVMRVYRREPPGDLLHSFTLSLANLAAGNEGDATANGYWIPVAADVGREYLFTADVTTEHDQVEPNNHLAPVTVLITAAEPPPPPILGNHATQHENGGGDEINLDGLAGKLLEDQNPTAHKTTHASGGADELSVAGLKGQLADPQPTSPHHLEHQLGGSDKLNVNGLFGTLDGDQKPKAHGSAKHDETVASRDGTGLVPTAELGTGQPGQAAFLRGDRTWAAPIATPSAHAETHEADGDDQVSIAGLSGKTADAQTPEHHKGWHEALGADEISIAGLSGTAADPQTPAGHYATHQFEGSDILNVNGLSGTLADNQPPKAHKASHELAGTDELSVAGLHGVLADGQPIQLHAASHQPSGNDQISIAGLNGVPACAGAENGLAPLDANALLPTLHMPGHAPMHSSEGSDPLNIDGLEGLPVAAGAAEGLATLNATSKLTYDQLPAHAASHGPLGGDTLDVTGLSGLLASAQTPAVHGNQQHDTSPSEPHVIREPNFSGAAGQSANVARADHEHRATGSVRLLYTSGWFPKGAPASPIISAEVSHYLLHSLPQLAGGLPMFTTREIHLSVSGYLYPTILLPATVYAFLSVSGITIPPGGLIIGVMSYEVQPPVGGNLAVIADFRMLLGGDDHGTYEISGGGHAAFNNGAINALTQTVVFGDHLHQCGVDLSIANAQIGIGLTTLTAEPNFAGEILSASISIL